MNELATIKKEKEKAEVSIDVKTDYIIIFNDDSTRQVPKKTAENIIMNSGGNSKFFILEGNMINYSNIARLITIQEYYGQFPDERPEAYSTINYPPIGDYKTAYLTTAERLAEALGIWKKQLKELENGGNGGLRSLISWGENKLILLKKKKKKEITLSTEIKLDKEQKVNKEDRLKAIREKRLKN